MEHSSTPVVSVLAMTLVSRACLPVATLTLLFALGCATQPPLAASPAANSRPRVQLEPEQPSATDAAAEPEPERTELRCEDDLLTNEPGTGKAHRALVALVQTASTALDLACVQRLVERFFPVMARERPPPQDLAALPDWWRTLGSASYYTADDPNVFVVMPEPVPRLNQAARRRLAAVLCSANDVACGAEARTFLADAEEQMVDAASLARVEQFLFDAELHPLPEAAIEACTVEARKQRREYAFSVWQSCVTEAVPQLVRTPSGAFRMPEQGILTTRRSGFWDPCSEVTGFALASGLALTKVECALSDEKRRVSRWRLSRVSPSSVRRIALFVALMDQMRTGPANAKRIPVPAGIPRDGSAHGYGRSQDRRISDVPEFTYSVHGVLTKPLSGSVYAYDEIEPKNSFLARLLRTSQLVGTTSCAETPDQPVIAQLLAKMLPKEPDRRTMEVQVTRIVSCPQ